jgi:TatD DNase family protein
MRLIDSHAHLDFEQFHGDFNEVILRAKQSGVEKIVNIGADIKRSQATVELAENHDNIYAVVGIHPEEENELGLTESITELENLIKSSRRVVAVGECGLDYNNKQSKEEKAKQLALFEAQIELAQGHHLPMVIHIRNGEDDLAYEDAKMVLDKNKVDNGVVHCFTFGPCEAQAFLDMGLSIGFTGIITYKNAEKVRDAVKIVPLDKLLVETDCPFLAPQGHRGERNEPAYVVEVAEKVAEIKGITTVEVAKATAENAERLFRI